MKFSCWNVIWAVGKCVSVKRMVTIVFASISEDHFVKDVCSYPYYLGKYCDWSCVCAYFTDGKPLKNVLFEQYCALKYLGKANNYPKQKEIAAEYLRQYAKQFDVLCFFHYGGASYSLARLAKRLNPTIKVYIKLDMNEKGFAHFHDGTFLRKIKILPEYWKSRAVDLFTVENRSFYRALKGMRLFKNRIEYLPNAVSLFGVDLGKISRPKQKENILLTVGRLGTHVKNNELLVEAIRKVSRSLFNDWKFLFVGPAEAHFVEYVKRACEADAWMAEHLVLFGEVKDRMRLYELYAKAKIVCMTSRSESFCIALMEAMFFGAYPVITHFGSIIDDLTKDRRYGMVSPQEDVIALTEALEKIAGEEKLAVLSQSVEHFVRDNFSYEVWTKKLDEYLTDLLTR